MPSCNVESADSEIAGAPSSWDARAPWRAACGRTVLGVLTLVALLLSSRDAEALSPSDVTISAVTPFAAVDSNNCAGGAGPHAMYVQVNVTNASPGTLSGLSATLNGIPAAPVSPPSPPTAFTLGAGESTQRFIGTLAPGGVGTMYFFVNYPCTLPPAVGSSIGYTVQVSDGASTVTSSALTLTTRSEISASAGGDVLSAVIGPGAVVGQILKVTINYSFGNPSASADAMFQPAGNVSFQADRYRLLAADITASTFTAGPLTTNDNRLYFAPGTVNGPSQNSVTVDYYFLALATGPASTVVPFADLRSGTQVKYTGNFGTCTNSPCDHQLWPPDDPFVITKTASPTSLPAGGTATYTVTIANTSSFDSSVDSIHDTLPAGVTYQGFAPGSGVTGANSSVVPAIGAGGTIVWQAQPGVPPPASAKNWFIPAHATLTLVYNASLPATPGTYANSVTATSSNLVVGPASADVFVGPTPTSTATTVPTNTATAVPTATDTAVPTSTATSVPTNTATAVPSATNTSVPTSTATSVPTDTATVAPTATNTSVPTDTATAVPTATDTSVPTSTATGVPTDTAAVPTSTDTAAATATATSAPTETATAAATATDTAAPTATATGAPTATDTTAPTATATSAPTDTVTAPPTATSTAIATDTVTASPTATAIPAQGICPPLPRQGCLEPTGFKKRLRISIAKDKLTWRWRSAGNVPLADYGDPLTTSDYSLCIYAGATPVLVSELRAPAGGSCNKGRPCWKKKRRGKGFRYLDLQRTPDGISRWALRSTAPPLSDIAMRARGGNVPFPTLPLELPVRVQAIRGDAPTCWETIHSAPALKNSGSVFLDKND